MTLRLIRLILPAILLIIAIGIAFYLYLDAKKETPKTTKRHTCQEKINYDLPDYMAMLAKTKIRDPDLQQSVVALYEKMKQMQDVIKRFPETNKDIEKFLDKYMPMYLKSLETFNNLGKTEGYAKVKQKMLNVTDKMNIGMASIINRIEENRFDQASVEINALEMFLDLNGEVQENLLQKK